MVTSFLDPGRERETGAIGPLRVASRARPLAVRIPASRHATRARRVGAAGQLGGGGRAWLPEHVGAQPERTAVLAVPARPAATRAERDPGDSRSARRSVPGGRRARAP